MFIIDNKKKKCRTCEKGVYKNLLPTDSKLYRLHCSYCSKEVNRYMGISKDNDPYRLVKCETYNLHSFSLDLEDINRIIRDKKWHLTVGGTQILTVAKVKIVNNINKRIYCEDYRYKNQVTLTIRCKENNRLYVGNYETVGDYKLDLQSMELFQKYPSINFKILENGKNENFKILSKKTRDKKDLLESELGKLAGLYSIEEQKKQYDEKLLKWEEDKRLLEEHQNQYEEDQKHGDLNDWKEIWNNKIINN